MKLIKRLSIFLGVVICLLPIAANAKTTYIYEGMENSNYHMHVTYHQNGAIRVGWFKLKPNVTRLGGWSCGDYGRNFKCKEPNGITQHFKFSSDKKIMYGSGQKFKFLKKVNQ